MKSSAALSALLALLTPAAGVLGLLRPNAAPQIRPQQQLTGGTDATSLDGTATGTNGWGTFNQLIDHSNPSLGTFKQRYWYGTKYWNGPGSPIILVSMAEQDASGSNQTYLGLSSMPGVMAQAVGGAVIILEYRYFGASSPFDQLTVENLQYLTLDNLAKDQTYFANNFDPPFDHSGKSSPKNAAWVYVGAGSAGYLISYMDVVSPGTFWAYYGSGSSVQPIGDFWQYFTPVQEAASANCSSDINLVIEYVDDILLHGTEDEKLKLKDKFQLRDLTDADFACMFSVGPWQWQAANFYDSTYGYSNSFLTLCDYVENAWPGSKQPVPDAKGVGLEKAMEGYAKWWNDYWFPDFCSALFPYPDWQGKYNVKCMQNSDPNNAQYKDLNVSNSINRQYTWLQCNEPLEFWQDGPPPGQPALVSRLMTRDYSLQYCNYLFPPSEGGVAIQRGKTAADLVRVTGGWDRINTTRVMYTNGQLDPWRDATMSSVVRPGGPLKSTPELPVRVVENGTHCSELIVDNWAVNPALKQLATEAVQNMKQWVDEFRPQQS